MYCFTGHTSMNINIKAYLIKCTIMLLLIVWCDCVDPIELPSEHECIIVCPPPLRIQLLPSAPEGPQKWSRVVKLVEGVCAVVANTRLPRASVTHSAIMWRCARALDSLATFTNWVSDYNAPHLQPYRLSYLHVSASYSNYYTEMMHSWHFTRSSCIPAMHARTCAAQAGMKARSPYKLILFCTLVHCNDVYNVPCCA